MDRARERVELVAQQLDSQVVAKLALGQQQTLAFQTDVVAVGTRGQALNLADHGGEERVLHGPIGALQFLQEVDVACVVAGRIDVGQIRRNEFLAEHGHIKKVAERQAERSVDHGHSFSW